jgi:hypothetical protein
MVGLDSVVRVLPKYVVSSTLEHPRWSNATVLKGDVVAEVSQLKQEFDGEILVYASACFAASGHMRR